MQPGADNPTTETPRGDDCWNRVGVQGDRTCPRLRESVHCAHCPVYAEAGLRLFERDAPAEYVEEWTRRLAESAPSAAAETVAVLVFRLSDEWLAIPVDALVEVAPPHPIHRVPHRTNRFLLGLANIRGELQLCVSLRELLGVEGEAAPPAHGPRPAGPAAQRLLVTEHGSGRWVFPVDEVAGVHRVSQADLADLPSTVERSPRRYSRAIFTLDGRKVGLLDEARLLESLERTVL